MPASWVVKTVPLTVTLIVLLILPTRAAFNATVTWPGEATRKKTLQIVAGLVQPDRPVSLMVAPVGTVVRKALPPSGTVVAAIVMGWLRPGVFYEGA